MSQFHIQAQQAQRDIHFATTQVSEAPAVTASSQDSPKASLLAKADALKLSGTATDKQAQPENLQDLLGPDAPKPKSEAFVERLTTRESKLAVQASNSVSLELGTESEAPDILTTDRDPNTIESLQTRFQNPHQHRPSSPLQSASASAGGEQVVKTGASLQAGKRVKLQLGMASRVDTSKLNMSGSPGVYAGLAIQSDVLSSRLMVDTAYGEPRFEVGTALNTSKNSTVGVSYQQAAHNHFSALRVGAEVKVVQDTTLGLNLHHPLSAESDNGFGTSLGLYLSSRFR